MKVRLRDVSTFVASGLLTMLIVSPMWPHGFPRGAGVVLGRGGPTVFVPFPGRFFGPIIIGGGAIGTGMGHRGNFVYPWGYYPIIPPAESPYPSPSPYGFEVKPAGRLHISVQPQNAEVLVDGMRLEPVEDHAFDVGLLVGSHTVQVAKEGYRTHTSEASIETAKTTTLSIELEKQ
jgi:hypothetical protein